MIYCRIYTSIYPVSKPFRVTTWDALGYYMYLPGIFIYHDISKCDWLPVMEKKYDLSGGNIYQANKIGNGNRATKYLGGIALLELPFFFVGHLIAIERGLPVDGFSPPYQYAISYGILLYFLLGIFILRYILLRNFSDFTSALTLLLLAFATNAMQYAALESAQSHSPLFFLYALVIYCTLKWHEKPTLLLAGLTGLIIGIANISRPTAAIMLFIPLLWNTQYKNLATEKWQWLKAHPLHILAIILFGSLGVLPQLIYWKIVTGHFVFDVGSKWSFLSPFFRVLFGFEKGWFIYTPITIFFVVGLFFIRKFPFKNSTLWFCLLNLWIIISWYDWRYGASYSTRALMQSYPVFSLALGAFIEWIRRKRAGIVFYGLWFYLIVLNVIQLWQYNHSILLFDGMTRNYYRQIYLKLHPGPLALSLQDNPDWINDEGKFYKQIISENDTLVEICFSRDSLAIIAELNIKTEAGTRWNESYLKIESTIKTEFGDAPYLFSELNMPGLLKQNKVRLMNAIYKPGAYNDYAFYVKVPQNFEGKLKVYMSTGSDYKGSVKRLTITKFNR